MCSYFIIYESYYVGFDTAVIMLVLLLGDSSLILSVLVVGIVVVVVGFCVLINYLLGVLVFLSVGGIMQCCAGEGCGGDELEK